MAIVRLTNEQWGLATNCFVCEPRNERGLRLEFFHDTETDVVSSEFTLSNDYSGAPNFVHGGVTLAILDEAQAWAPIAVCHRFAVTAETTTQFLRPIYVDRQYRVEVTITDQNPAEITTAALVLDPAGKVKAQSRSRFVVIGEALAAEALGHELHHHHDYLRQGPDAPS